jgi:hypothetical protein
VGDQVVSPLLGPRGKIIVLMVLTTALSSGAARSSDLDVARSWGLLGRWAERCDKPPAYNNYQELFEPRGGDSPTSIEMSLDFGPDDPVIIEQLKALVVLPNGRLQFQSERGGTRIYAQDPTGKLRLMDTISTSGHYTFREGVWTFRDRVINSRWLVRCNWAGS